MPSTLPGFLLAAGLAMFLFSLFKDPIEVKGIRLPTPGKAGQIVIGILGVLFMCLGGYLYFHYLTSPGLTKLPIWFPSTKR
jgi:hypothetical protein